MTDLAETLRQLSGLTSALQSAATPSPPAINPLMQAVWNNQIEHTKKLNSLAEEHLGNMTWSTINSNSNSNSMLEECLSKAVKRIESLEKEIAELKKKVQELTRKNEFLEELKEKVEHFILD